MTPEYAEHDDYLAGFDDAEKAAKARIARLENALREIEVIARGWDIHGRDRIAAIAHETTHGSEND